MDSKQNCMKFTDKLASSLYHKNPDSNKQYRCLSPELREENHCLTPESISAVSSKNFSNENLTVMNISNVEGHHIQVERISHIQDENKKNRLLNVNGFYPIKPLMNISYEDLDKRPNLVGSSHCRIEKSNSSIKDRHYIRSNSYSNKSEQNKNVASSSKFSCLTDSIIMNSSKDNKGRNSDFNFENSARNEVKSSVNLNDNVDCLPDGFNTRTQVFVRPSSNSFVYHQKNKNASNCNTAESNIGIHSHEYDSEIGKRENLIRSTDVSRPTYLLHNADINKNHLTITANKNESESYSIQVLPVHQKKFKNANIPNKFYNSSLNTKPGNNSLNTQLLLQTQHSSIPESLNRKKLELQAKAEQLRITEEIVKKREEEAQAKTWQALQQQEALLLEKERNLKYREILAQRKYEEAMKILEESRNLSEHKRLSVNSNTDSDPLCLEKSLIINKYQNHTGQVFNIDSSQNSKIDFDSSNIKSVNSQSDEQSYEHRGKAKGNLLQYKISSKPSLKVSERKSKIKKKYSALDMLEIKPTIEPSKILHTYSRKSPKKQKTESKFKFHEPFVQYNEMQDNNDLDIPEAPRNLKEHVLVNESGTLTITQLPKFDQPIRPQSALPHLHSLSGKRKLDESSIMSSFSHPLKKCPSRIEIDSSPYSSSSDLSISFTEKVEKLTSDFQFYNKLVEKKINNDPQSIKIPQNSMKNMQYSDNQNLDESYKQSLKNKDTLRERLSIVTLEGISYPSELNKSEFNSVIDCSPSICKKKQSDSSLIEMEPDHNSVKIIETSHEDKAIEITKNKALILEEFENEICDKDYKEKRSVSMEYLQKRAEYKSLTNNNVFPYEFSVSGEKLSTKDIPDTVEEYIKLNSEKNFTDLTEDSNSKNFKNIIISNTPFIDLNGPSPILTPEEKIGNIRTCSHLLNSTFDSPSLLNQGELCDKSKVLIDFAPTDETCISFQTEETDYYENSDSVINNTKEKASEEYLEEFNCLQNLSFSNNEFLNSEYILSKELATRNCEQTDVKSIPLINSYPGIVDTVGTDLSHNLVDNCKSPGKLSQRKSLLCSNSKDNLVISSNIARKANSPSNVLSINNENNLKLTDCKSLFEKRDSQMQNLNLVPLEYVNSELTKNHFKIKAEKDMKLSTINFNQDQKTISNIGYSNNSICYTSSIIYTSPAPESAHIYTTNTPSCATLDIKGNENIPTVSENPELGREEVGALHSITANETEKVLSPKLNYELTENHLKNSPDYVAINIQKPSIYKEEIVVHSLNESESQGNQNCEKNAISKSNKESADHSHTPVVDVLNNYIDSFKPESISNFCNSYNIENSDEPNRSTSEGNSSKVSNEIDDNDSVTPFMNRSLSPDFYDNDVEATSSSDKNPNVTSRRGRIVKLKDWWPDMVAEPQTKSKDKENSISNPNSKEIECSDDAELIKPKRRRGKRRKKRNFALNKSKKLPENNDFSFWLECVFPTPFEEDSTFECGKCDEIFNSISEFRSHAFLCHSGLVRVKGETQEFDDHSSQEIIKLVFKIHNKLICDKCKSSFKSILGFNYHRERCGIKLRYANRERRKKCRVEFLLGNKDVDIFKHGREKRKAARTCYDHMKLLYENIDAIDDISKDKDFESKSDLFMNFSRTSDIDSSCLEYESFIENIKKDGESKCINSNCKHVFNDVNEFKLHLKTCSYSEYFICKICNLIVKECDANVHMEENHNDYLSDNSDDSVLHYKMGYAPYKPFLDSKKMTAEFRENNYSKCLFHNLHCIASEWIEIDEYEVSLYQSSIKHSPKFKWQQNYVNNNSNEWDRIEYLSGKILGSGSVIFSGGPIRSSAWCPLPDGNLILSQYVALASLTNPDKCFPVNESEQHKGLIQIWNCGTLRESAVPFLSLCIAHEFGVLWSLDWCPSGIYEKESDDNGLNRLGMLAGAFSDGSIRIYLIPHPHQINSKTKVFKKKPDISLYYSNLETTKLQCVKVNWCSAKNHSLIAGSFTNGMVCIWDLNSGISLLKSDDKGHTVLFPVNSIHAHNGVCSTVSFCPQTEGQNIVTGGIDRTIKFWDLTQPDHPLSVIRKGIVTDSLWLPHWAGSFFSFDDAFSLGKTSTLFRENGFFGGSQRTIVGSNASVWCVDGSDWYNAVIQIDEAGEVMVSCQRNLICENLNEKYMKKKRFPLFSVRLESIKDEKVLNLKDEYYSKQSLSLEHENNGESNLDQSYIQSSYIMNKKFNDLPLTFASASEIYGIKICDEHYNDASKLTEKVAHSKQYSEHMEPGPLTIYPLMGGSSVSWNNNLGTHSWIFVGMNSGLGRIIRLSFLE